MKSINSTMNKLATKHGIAALTKVYSSEAVIYQSTRWQKLITQAQNRNTPDTPCFLVRSPGRTELGGNHTDHNLGRALVGTLCKDIIGVVVPNTTRQITIIDIEHDTNISIDSGDTSVHSHEYNSTEALIRGCVSRMQQLKYYTKGFTIYTQTDVSIGSGLSSSAAFELLIIITIETLARKNNSTLPPLSISSRALVGQYAENNYFNKPCGVEDQLGAASGGITAINFFDLKNIELYSMDVTFDKYGITLGVCDVDADHAELTDEYTSIPNDMNAIAKTLGQHHLAQVRSTQFFESLPLLRRTHGDRAVLRALHFYRDTERVQQQIQALDNNNIDQFLRLVRASGSSSWRWLQNCVPTGATTSQPMATLLAFTEDYCIQHHIAHWACRVHGGGFAGAIQVFIPHIETDSYIRYLHHFFPSSSYTPLAISPIGAATLLTDDPAD